MIYVVGNKEHKIVKIGCTRSLQTFIGRFKILRSGFPYPLKVFKLCTGSTLEEYEIHQELIKHRLEGKTDWFKAKKKVVKKINELPYYDIQEDHKCFETSHNKYQQLMNSSKNFKTYFNYNDYDQGFTINLSKYKADEKAAIIKKANHLQTNDMISITAITGSKISFKVINRMSPCFVKPNSE